MPSNKLHTRNSARIHALRLDRSSLLQGALALVLTFTIAWLFQIS